MNMVKTNETAKAGPSEVNAGHLRAFCNGIEVSKRRRRRSQEISRMSTAEAKANGFDVKIMRKIVSIRKQDRDSRIEEETILYPHPRRSA